MTSSKAKTKWRNEVQRGPCLEKSEEEVTAEEKDAIETACKELEEVSKGDDKDAIETKTKALEEVFTPVAQKAYADQAQAAGGAEGAQQEEAKADEDVVDAEVHPHAEVQAVQSQQPLPQPPSA